MVQKYGFAAAALLSTIFLDAATALPQLIPQELLAEIPCDDEAVPLSTITRTVTWHPTITKTLTVVDATETVTLPAITTSAIPSPSSRPVSTGPVQCTLGPTQPFRSGGPEVTDMLAFAPGLISTYALQLAEQFCSSDAVDAFSALAAEGFHQSLPIRIPLPPPEDDDNSAAEMELEGDEMPFVPPQPLARYRTAGSVTFSFEGATRLDVGTSGFEVERGRAEQCQVGCMDAMHLIIRNCQFGETPGHDSGSLDLGCGRWRVVVSEEREAAEGNTRVPLEQGETKGELR